MPIDYPILKMIHVACVVASYVLFFVRGVWMLLGSPWLQKRWVRIVQHMIDTGLLASAVAMVIAIRQYPFSADWLTAKLLALICYIALGMVSLRFARTRGMRLAAWLAAQAVFFYIVAVAVTRNPLPWTTGT
jgi:uncharacterized membrane protein SirB2